jgi:hypothetical protein
MVKLHAFLLISYYQEDKQIKPKDQQISNFRNDDW